MWEKETPCSRKQGTLKDTVVDQFIMQDEVFLAKKIADGCDIGGMAANENDGIIDAVGLGDAPFKFPVNGAISRKLNGWPKQKFHSGLLPFWTLL